MTEIKEKSKDEGKNSSKQVKSSIKSNVPYLESDLEDLLMIIWEFSKHPGTIQTYLLK